MEENDTLTHVITLVIFRIGANHASTLIIYINHKKFGYFKFLNVETFKKCTKNRRTKYF